MSLSPEHQVILRKHFPKSPFSASPTVRQAKELWIYEEDTLAPNPASEEKKPQKPQRGRKPTLVAALKSGDITYGPDLVVEEIGHTLLRQQLGAWDSPIMTNISAAAAQASSLGYEMTAAQLTGYANYLHRVASDYSTSEWNEIIASLMPVYTLG